MESVKALLYKNCCKEIISYLMSEKDEEDEKSLNKNEARNFVSIHKAKIEHIIQKIIDDFEEEDDEDDEDEDLESQAKDPSLVREYIFGDKKFFDLIKNACK